jgi:hypothetical protein
MADRIGQLRIDASLKDEAEHEHHLEKLQKRALTVQRAYCHQGRRAIEESVSDT